MAEPRGKSLEREFADWMRSNLGYKKTRLRVPVKGKIAERGYEVDVHGEKFSPFWNFVRLGGAFIVLLAALTVMMPKDFEAVGEVFKGVIASIEPTWAGSALLIVGGTGLALGFMGKNRATTHAWVECKDTKSNVKRAMVQKLAASVEDVRECEDAKWKP